MSPIPKEFEPYSYRKPISLLYQVIEEGRYPWLVESLKGKTVEGFLVDSSGKNLCVHLITGWSREGRSHRVVQCGDDFEKIVELKYMSLLGQNEKAAYQVNWGDVVGVKNYEQVEVMPLYFLGTPHDFDKIRCLSFKELEDGLLRAAGRLLE